MGIGAIFGGLAQGLQAGIGLAQHGEALRQHQETVDIEKQKNDIQMGILQSAKDDAQTYAAALQPTAQAQQQDSQVFSMLSQAGDLAKSDPSLRKTQLPVFVSAFKQATGKDLAPNVVDALGKGDSDTLSALIDNATHSVLSGGAKATDVVKLLTDPVASSKWLASQGAAVAGKDATTINPAANALKTQQLVLQRQVGYAQQSADNIRTAIPRMSNPAQIAAATKQMNFYQQQVATINGKIADLSKGYNLTPGASHIGPDGVEATQADKSKVLSPDEYKQAVSLAADKAGAATAARLKANPALNAHYTQEATDLQAEQYLQTGTMPSVGYGAQGYAQRAAVANRAGELAQQRGDTAGMASARMAYNKNTLAANRGLQAQETKIVAFSDAADKNADLVLNLSGKVDRTGSPALNRWILNGRKELAGDVDVNNLNIGINGLVNEYTKVVNGATGSVAASDSARKEAHALIANAHTDEQLRGAVATIRTEMANRLQGFKDQNKAVLTQLGGGASSDGALPAQTNQPPTTAAPAKPTSPAASNIPTVTTPEQWNALKRGQRYFDPKGNPKVKQ